MNGGCHFGYASAYLMFDLAVSPALQCGLDPCHAGGASASEPLDDEEEVVCAAVVPQCSGINGIKERIRGICGSNAFYIPGLTRVYLFRDTGSKRGT